MSWKIVAYDTDVLAQMVDDEEIVFSSSNKPIASQNPDCNYTLVTWKHNDELSSKGIEFDSISELNEWKKTVEFDLTE